jgi:hypothetical protein
MGSEVRGKSELEERNVTPRISPGHPDHIVSPMVDATTHGALMTGMRARHGGEVA